MEKIQDLKNQDREREKISRFSFGIQFSEVKKYKIF